MASSVLDVTDSNSPKAPAPRPYVTIRAGGPLHGVVRITATADGAGRTLVEASWTQDGQPYSDTLELDTSEDARNVANSAANQLAAGKPPDLTRA